MAFEVGVSVVSEIVKSALVAATHQARYFLCFNKYVDDLQGNKTELTNKRESVHERLEKAKNEAKKIDTVVINWMEQANSLIEEVQKLEEEANSNKSYCFRHFPNWIWRYHTGKLIVEKTEAAIKLINESNFEEFARPATPPGMKYFSLEGFIYFESTKMAYDKLLEALKDDEVSMIGLYGMGGCGKTTLAKQVGKEVEMIFNKVAFVVVSNNVNDEKIQGEIASYLNLPLKKTESTSERARTLWGRLTSGEKTLIILDDVWGKLDFENIGIPIGKSCKGCKVLLTTRRLRVCTLMGCHRAIPLSLLNKDEARTLFQKHSGIAHDTSSPLMGLSKEILKECKELPVAIVAVATTLKGKSISEWQEALERLKEATPIDIDEGLRDPYKCLQLSYDNLQNEEAKSLFLMCSVFPEDFEIHEEYLTRYGIGLGLFGEISHYARARNKVSEAKNKLMDSCLLLKGKNEQYVKMHDLVRDLALFIAKKERRVIAGLDSSRRNSTLEDNTVIRYLWYFKTQKMDNLSYLLGCPKLEFLCVKISRRSVLDDGVFKTMKHLRVLIFHHESGYNAQLATKSIQWLTNLRYLFLRGWNLVDISFIGSLKSLESLVLWHCSFEELPNEITELSKLRLLDLWLCETKRNTYEVIRRCSQLEELYFLHNISGLNKEGAKVVATSGLQRYHIEIREGLPAIKRLFRLLKSYRPPENFSFTRGLWLRNTDALTSDASIKDLVRRAQFLELHGIKNARKNIIPEMVDVIGGGMNELTQLHLLYCDEIECFVDTSNPTCSKFQNIPFNLVKLQIRNLSHMQSLWHGPYEGKLNPFCSLKVLDLRSCQLLASVFTCAVAQTLVALEEVDIKDCDGLKHIVSEEHNHNKSPASIMFTKLQRLSVYNCSNLEAICPESYCLWWLSLKELHWENCPKLKQDQLDSNVLHDSQTISQLSLSQMVQVMERVYISECEEIEGIFHLPGHPTRGDHQQLLTSCLQYLKLDGLKELSYIYKGPENFVCLQNLLTLEVFGCAKLKFIFSATIFRSLPQLKKLCIKNCPQLEQIIEDGEIQEILNHTETNEVSHCPNSTRSEEFHNAPEKPGTSKCFSWYKRHSKSLNPHKHKRDEEDQKNQNGKTAQKLQSDVSIFPRLEILSISECELLESIFPILFAQDLFRLEEMAISKNPQLKYIFNESNQGSCLSYQSQNRIQIELPSLKKLNLEDLPNIISICPGNYPFKCPSLQKFSFNSVGLQVMSMDNLMNGSQVRLWNDNSVQEPEELVKDEIQLDREDDILQNIKQIERLEVGNCNIHVICQLEGFPITRKHSPVIISLSDMKLENLPELGFLCKGPRKSLSLKHLTRLSIEKCRNLTFTFSSSILRSFPLLKSLTIKQCEQLQQIIEEDEKYSNSLNYHSQQVCFPRLTTIDIQQCNNLKYFFLIFSSHELPQLEELIVEECSLLQNVFAHKESDTEDGQSIMFSKLRKLRLSKLPNLMNVYEGVKWHPVDDQQVEDCPLLQQEHQDQGSREDDKTQTETPSKDGSSLSANTADERDRREVKSHATLADPKQGKDIDMQTSTDQDINPSVSIAPTNQEHRTSEMVGNMKKMENENATNQSTLTYPDSTETQQTQAETFLPESTLQAKSIGETNLESVQNGLASVKSTMETPSLEVVKQTSKIDSLSIDQPQESFEANKVHLGDPPSDLDLNKAANVEQKMHQVSSENKEEELASDSTLMEQQKTYDEKEASKKLQLIASKSQLAPISASSPSSGEASINLPTPEEKYASFRDIGAIKEKHIPLLEKAFANHSSLCDWHKKFKHPEMKQLGYAMLGNTLEFLESTRWRDLTEEKKAEFESLVNGMEAFGFDIQWLGIIRARIKHSKFDEGSIKQKQMLEEKVAEENHKVEEMKVHLQKLLEYKLELEAIEAELKYYNNFIGF